jgi:hypothetical protein
MKRTITFLTIIAVIAVMFSGCKKDSADAPVTDARDQYVGSYTETLNGTMTVTVMGVPQSTPINTNGTFTIVKGSAANRIVRIDIDSSRTEATISGTHVQFDPIQETYTENGMTMTITSDVSGTLSGNVLNYTITMSGSAVLQGMTFPLTGSINGVATKQ